MIVLLDNVILGFHHNIFCCFDGFAVFHITIIQTAMQNTQTATETNPIRGYEYCKYLAENQTATDYDHYTCGFYYIKREN